MWQEARKQEKKLRGIMIDYKKRAERRQAYYAKMRTDPHQLMRVYGQKCKFHMLGENANVTNTDGQLMPWPGDPDIMIDRFDVRAHLDYIPESKPEVPERTEEEEKFERKCSYESYRTLVQIDATGATQEQYLKQLATEEAFGKKAAETARLEKEKLKSKAQAKIHYQYEDSTVQSDDGKSDESDEEESDSDLSDIDINVNVLELEEEQKNHLDALATQYGIGYGQYCKQLLLEKKEFEYVKRLEEEEEERSKMPGRRGKSARRTLRIKQKNLRGSPLSFALQEIPAEDNERHKADGSESSAESSREGSPVVEKVEFITEFGGDVSAIAAQDKKNKSIPEARHKTLDKKSRKRSRSRSNSKHRKRRSKSKDRHRSRSRDRRHRRSRSRSRSRERSSRYSRNQPRSRSRSRDKYSRRRRSSSSSSSERSRDNHRNESRSKKRSKSPSKTPKKSRSRSRSEERSRSQSPHISIVKRLGTDKVKPAVIDKSKLTPREKMKLRMQKLLNKQIKSDKKEEQKKQVIKEQETEERELQIYELSKLMKHKEREKKRRSPSPKGHIASYDASDFSFRPRSRSRSL